MRDERARRRTITVFEMASTPFTASLASNERMTAAGLNRQSRLRQSASAAGAKVGMAFRDNARWLGEGSDILLLFGRRPCRGGREPS
jgi:hypothetical protein